MILKPATKFEDLLVWQKAHRLVIGIYHLTQEFPKFGGQPFQYRQILQRDFAKEVKPIKHAILTLLMVRLKKSDII